MDTYPRGIRFALVSAVVLALFYVLTIAVLLLDFDFLTLFGVAKSVQSQEARFVNLVAILLTGVVLIWMLYDIFIGRLRSRVPRKVLAIDYQAAFEWNPEPVGDGEPDWRVGTKVRHRDFGIGHVANLAGAGATLVATVNFENAGTKRILVSKAPLRATEDGAE